MNEMKIGTGRHRFLCRWWLKTKQYKNTDQIEFYVPWWAWPLEILHRCIFGSVKLQKEKNNV